MNRIPYYLTVDFEDFHHDYQRLCGVTNPKFKRNALIASYDQINLFLKNKLNNQKITFFVTGIVAKFFPDLIKKISDDGHEIGSHYFYHDNIRETNRQNFSDNLYQSKDSIFKAIKSNAIGFRAPNFAIDQDDFWAYEEISKNFLYDSSCKVFLDDARTINEYETFFKKIKLYQFYISQKKFFSTKLSIRSGGTFMKVFSIFSIIKLMQDSSKKKITPILYLHPYELLSKDFFWIKLSDFEGINYKKYYYWLKQLQWTCFGGEIFFDKISIISNFFSHQGLLKDNNNFRKFSEKNKL